MGKKSTKIILSPEIKEEDIVREVKIQGSLSKERNYTQLFAQIPAIVAQDLNIQKGDILVFKVPLNKKEYSIKLKKQIK